MRSQKQWKVQQLLRLAELCTDEQQEKKDFYMEEVERLLFSNDEYSAVLDHIKSNNRDIAKFLEFCKENQIAIENNLVSDVYKEYLDFCEVEQVKPKSKNLLSRSLKTICNFSTKTVYFREYGAQRIYILE